MTDPLHVKTIHFGLSGGGATTSGSFQIDNLTIGSEGAAIPEPATIGLLGIGLTGLFIRRRLGNSSG